MRADSSSWQLAHATGDGLEVREHAAEPALVHVRHAAGDGELGHRVLGLLLRADEHDRPAAGDEVADEGVGGVDALQRLVQVDDVDAVALAEDETLHLRVPATGLMAEVDSGLEHLLHRDDGHGSFPPDGCADPGTAPISATAGVPGRDFDRWSKARTGLSQKS